MPHKVTYFTTGLARAGAEIQLLLLCDKFVKAGWEVSVISLLPPVALVPELEQLGIPLVSLDLSRHFPDPRVFVRLVRTLRTWSPDVLHCHQVHANLIGRVAGAFTNIPVVVCTAHSINETPRWREWAYRITDGLCDMTTNVCQAGVDRYVRVGASPANKICYLPNGVDLDCFVPGAERRAATRTSLGLKDEFVWLAVGNLREPKDYPTMLEAFREVRIAKPDTRLLIAGAGPLKEQLQLQVKANGIGGVSFLGPRVDVADLMCAVDGFVMSSLFEGTPLALLEASAMNLPVVATRVGGISEVVVDGESGLLVESCDPAALASACLSIMNATPDQRAEFGRVGKNRVEALFGIDAVTKKWKQLYTHLIRQRAQARSLARGTT
jgi:glycosyltransferase involved in cell wall biosynthesis